MLTSPPGNAGQPAQISLGAEHAQDIWLMLTDALTILDDLTAAGARRAQASLRATDSPYTLGALITALDQTAVLLEHAARDAISAAQAAAASPPGYDRPAIDAITRAASTEYDFAGWLASVLATAATRLGSTDALTARRPGSWEASLVDQLVQGTTGYHDEHLPGYART